MAAVVQLDVGADEHGGCVRAVDLNDVLGARIFGRARWRGLYLATAADTGSGPLWRAFGALVSTSLLPVFISTCVTSIFCICICIYFRSCSARHRPGC